MLADEVMMGESQPDGWERAKGLGECPLWPGQEVCPWEKQPDSAQAWETRGTGGAPLSCQPSRACQDL